MSHKVYFRCPVSLFEIFFPPPSKALRFFLFQFHGMLPAAEEFRSYAAFLFMFHRVIHATVFLMFAARDAD